MKKVFLAIALLMALNLFGGCSKPQEDPIITPEPSVSEESTDPADGTEEESSVSVDETEEESSVSADELYAQQIERYYTALSENWDENAYFDNEMSSLAAFYYEGNPLDNVGYAFMDLDGDGIQELIIGAIYNSDKDPVVFEIWTLKNGEPVMLAQSGSRNRYYLQYAEDDGIWSVAYEAGNGAANYAVYYMQLAEGEFAVNQGIVFDAFANENEPWFMAYDLDWDVSNDTPIDEDTANDVMESERNIYTAAEYLPYSQHK